MGVEGRTALVTGAYVRAIRAKGVSAAFGPTTDATEIVASIERLARGSTE